VSLLTAFLIKACRNADCHEFVELFVEHLQKTAPKTKAEVINKLSQSHETPLTIALQHSPKAAEYLLVNDADPQLENVRDVWGNVVQGVQQPINLAAQCVSDPDLMEELCSKKIDHSYVHNQNTPLDAILARLDAMSNGLEASMRSLEKEEAHVEQYTHFDEQIKLAKDPFEKWVFETMKKVSADPY
jgi:hypothetical protein